MNILDIETARRQICEIGDRLYKRGFAAANDGNMTYRLSDDEVLCTPTMCCKGFLKPEELAVIDFTGKQISGPRPRSSEALLHLEIMKARPDVRCVLHCHPPHATAFAIAREPIPQGVLPEIEFFLGETPIAPYATPGSQKFAETILPFVKQTNLIVLANHGTVSYAETIEHAFWWTEILDAYCRILMLARQLGGVHYLSRDDVTELLEAKKKWGFSDPRHAANFEGDIIGHPTFGHTWEAAGVSPRAFRRPD